MARLEEMTRGSQVKGIRNDDAVEVLDVKWFGSSAIELTFKADFGVTSVNYDVAELLARAERPR